MSYAQHIDLSMSRKNGWQFSEKTPDLTVKSAVTLMTIAQAKKEYIENHPEAPGIDLKNEFYRKMNKSEIDVNVLEIERKRVLLTIILTDPETSSFWKPLPWRMSK